MSTWAPIPSWVNSQGGGICGTQLSQYTEWITQDALLVDPYGVKSSIYYRLDIHTDFKSNKSVIGIWIILDLIASKKWEKIHVHEYDLLRTMCRWTHDINKHPHIINSQLTPIYLGILVLAKWLGNDVAAIASASSVRWRSSHGSTPWQWDSWGWAVLWANWRQWSQWWHTGATLPVTEGCFAQWY